MNKIIKPHLFVRGASHPGMTGKQNEDRYQISSWSTGIKKQTPSMLGVLCDGIGGHRAGEIAAQIGVSTLTEVITASDAKTPLKTLEEAIHRASTAVYQASQSDQGRAGMGATCAVAWVIGNRLYTANLGDSRIYLFRGQNILQLTTDHTWVQEAYQAGIINDAERELHPNAHVIRRYLGSKKTPTPDFRMWVFEGESDADAVNNQGLHLEVDDTLLICSDGLTDLVSDEEIQTIIYDQPLDAAVDHLIDMANARGGHDNITVVLMRVANKKNFKKPRKRRLVTGCLLSLILLSAMIAAFFYGWRWWQNRLDTLETSQPTKRNTLSIDNEILQPTQTQTPVVSRTPTVQNPKPFFEEQPSITPWPTNTP